jgi:hypothetical protein
MHHEILPDGDTECDDRSRRSGTFFLSRAQKNQPCLGADGSRGNHEGHKYRH